MALNSSGPISLGGATTGQSINLELGQAATATTSLNATNVRTLLQVSSGQISLSNAYGKSSSTAYIIYLGNVYTSQTNNFNWSVGWQVNNQGMSMFGYGSPGGFTKVSWLSNTGTLLATTQLTQNYGANFVAMQNLFPSNNDQFILTYSALCTTAWSPSSSYLTPSIPNASFQVYNVISTIGMPNGNLVSWGYSDEGKYGHKPKFTQFSSSGNVYNTVAGNNYIGPDAWGKILRYTNGSFVHCWKYGNDVYIFTMTSTLTMTAANNTQRLQSISYAFGAEVDSSNNLYILGNLEGIYKISSGLTPVLTYKYTAIIWPCAYRDGVFARNAFGMSIYNDILYVATNGGDGTDSATANPGTLTVCAITCSTMNVLWTKRFTFTGANKYFTPFTNTTRGGGGIQARPTGVYISFFVTSNSGNAADGLGMTMCLPLDGNVANQTVTVNNGGAGLPMTITSPTNTRTTASFSMLSADPQTVSSGGTPQFATTTRQSATGISFATPKTAF